MAVAVGDSIQRYPLLRLLFFYLCGIGLADALYSHIPLLVTWGVWGSLFLLVILLITWACCRKALFGMVASGLFLMLGIWNYSRARSEAEYAWLPDKCQYEARVVDSPRTRERSILCEVEVTAVRDSSAWHRVGRKVFAYMEPCDEAEALLPGDILCFKGAVRAPRNFSDSLTFDYARYVTMQGAAGTVYLPRGHWLRVREEALTLRERLLRLRDRLLRQYEGAAFEDDVQGVLAALTLGDKRGLSREVRAAYSDAGASHVLALSGLHVGIIYGMLAFGLRRVLRKRSLRWLRELLTLVVLWLFALIVGMSASVVRAVAMCTLYVLARWLSDDTSSPLHVLSLTALLMLLVHPLYLFDIGFQLSFMAMASILCVEPYLEHLFLRGEASSQRLCHSKESGVTRIISRKVLRPLLGFFVSLLCMSLAAQLGTFPLVLHHFGTFPTYFLLTNLVVVPCLTVVLLLSLVWWTLLLLEVSWVDLLGNLLQHFVAWINQVLLCIGQWPGAVLHVEDFSLPAVLCTYLFILFVGLFVIKKWPRAIVFALAALLGLVVCLVFSA